MWNGISIVRACSPPQESPVKSIQKLYAASLLLGACVIASPSISAAQDTHKQDNVIAKADRQIDHQQTDHPVTTEPADHQAKQVVVQRGPVTRTVTTTRHGRRVVTRTTRTRVLCDDGTWSYSNCVDHGGLASRQYTPRASEVAVLHANEHSAVARAYANRLRASAVARCNDGTYWHATNHVRACYAHGGVARWY
jgi:hypothetical protein